MSILIPITALAGSLTQGVPRTPQEFYEEMMAKATFYWDGTIGFQNGGSEPTTNVGPWLKNGNEWRFWNPSTSRYDLGTFLPGMTMGWGGVSAPSGWLICNGVQLSTSTYAALFDAIGYNFNLAADNSGGNPINPTVFRIPSSRGRVFVGAGTGSGLTNRPLGSIGGSEDVTITVARMPAHRHRISEGGVRFMGTPFRDDADAGPFDLASGVNFHAGGYAQTLESGGGDPTPIMQPWQAINQIIKT